MKKRPAVVLGGLLTVSGAVALAAVSMRTQEASAMNDPRQEPPIVRLETATNQPYGFNAILGLIGLAGILMRNTLILTALAAVLAFIPLTHSVFWGSMAYTLIGRTAVGTVLILLFLPALYAAWFRFKPTADDVHSHARADERMDLQMADAEPAFERR
jgi:hypothetical protein